MRATEAQHRVLTALNRGAFVMFYLDQSVGEGKYVIRYLKSDKTIRPNTFEALLERGWIEKHAYAYPTIYVISDTGKKALRR